MGDESRSPGGSFDLGNGVRMEADGPRERSSEVARNVCGIVGYVGDRPCRELLLQGGVLDFLQILFQPFHALLDGCDIRQQKNPLV